MVTAGGVVDGSVSLVVILLMVRAVFSAIVTEVGCINFYVAMRKK